MPIVGQQPQGGGGGGGGQNQTQLILGLAQLQAQREAEAQRNKLLANQQRIAGLSTITDIARNTTDPTQLSSLARIAADNGLGNESDIMFLLSHVAPSAEAAKTGMAIRGFNEANGIGPLYGPSTPDANTISRESASTFFTGEGQGTVAQQGTTAKSLGQFEQNTPKSYRELLSNVTGIGATTGMAPDQLALSLAGANLPPDQQTAAAQIKQGTRMSAAQEAQIGVGYAGVRENANFHTAQIGISQANLDIEKFRALHAANPNAPKVQDLLDTQTQILGQLQKGGAAMSAADIQQRLTVLQQINTGLASQGYPVVPIDLGPDGRPDPKQVFSPSFSGYVSAWLSRK